MNELSKLETMSSREIAERTNKRHADVMRDIRSLAEQLINASFNERTSAPVKSDNPEYHREDRTQYKYLRKDTQEKILNWVSNEPNNDYVFLLSEYIDNKGEKRPEYLLTKKETLLLISGYNAVLRSKIIDRWEELEKTKGQISVSTLSRKDLAQMVLDAEIENEKLKAISERQQKHIDYVQPKAMEHQHYIDHGNAVNLENAAQALNTGRNRLIDFLKKKGILKRDNTPYQDYINKGYFVVKAEITNNGVDYMRTYVMPSGVSFISRLMLGINIQDQELSLG